MRVLLYVRYTCAPPSLASPVAFPPLPLRPPCPAASGAAPSFASQGQAAHIASKVGVGVGSLRRLQGGGKRACSEIALSTLYSRVDCSSVSHVLRCDTAKTPARCKSPRRICIQTGHSAAASSRLQAPFIRTARRSFCPLFSADRYKLSFLFWMPPFATAACAAPMTRPKGHALLTGSVTVLLPPSRVEPVGRWYRRTGTSP